MSWTSLDPPDEVGPDARRWAICLWVVVALHALAMLILSWRSAPVTTVQTAQQPAAVLVDLAPEPATAPTPPEEIPIGQAERQVAATKPLTLQRQPKLPLVHDAEVAVSSAEAASRQTQDRTPASQTASSAAAATSEPVAAVRKTDSNAAPTWQGLLLGRLEQFKRYPAPARLQGQQGVAYLRFSMNRDSEVLSAKIERSSGYALLDEEALALIHRAEPLPKPPPEVAGDTLELVVPIQFFLRGER